MYTRFPQLTFSAPTHCACIQVVVIDNVKARATGEDILRQNCIAGAASDGLLAETLSLPPPDALRSAPPVEDIEEMDVPQAEAVGGTASSTDNGTSEAANGSAGGSDEGEGQDGEGADGTGAGEGSTNDRGEAVEGLAGGDRAAGDAGVCAHAGAAGSKFAVVCCVQLAACRL